MTLLDEIATYYTQRLRSFGPTPAGVDWRDETSQRIRFEQLCKLIDDRSGSVLDLGCGYGALLEYLRAGGYTGGYIGVDLSEEMIATARLRNETEIGARFEAGSQLRTAADYVIASGIFNVRQNRNEEEWRTYIAATVAAMNGASHKGFSFNCLTSYSDSDRMRSDLYYGDPCHYFDLCKRLYSSNVALLHDYGLWEFTIIVRKT